ncbi:carbonic anhydrase [Burkholderia contaminans]|nr:carbonic anhydrase [Burkholderia contaminans]
MRVSLLPQLADLPQVARHIAPFSGLVWRYRDALDGRKGTAAAALLTELNVLEQGRLLRASQIARGRERPPLAQGWILSLADGRLQELDSGYATPAADVEPAQAVTAAARG